MNIKKTVIASLLTLPLAATAKGVIWNAGGTVRYATQQTYGTVVEKALEMFGADMKAVTGREAQHCTEAPIEIYQLDQATAGEQRAIGAYNIPTDSLRGRSDAFWMGVRKGKVVIVGSNGRGTAYGILELSRQAGVSPWIWWGDVTPEQRTTLTIRDDFETLQHPSVEFRGVFINDEDWANRVWDTTKLDPNLKEGKMGPVYYRRLFELLLRLRANALWPAMHPGSAGFFTIKGNKELADSFDICVGSSHCEPILRNNVAEWDSKRRGSYSWISNRREVEDYWRERARKTAGMDALYTIGMRGIHDGSMEGVKTPKEKLDGLQSVIDFQRQLLTEEVNADITKVPQVFIPYKEVLQIYEAGLRVPDDICLMWCDDNYGYMTRLSDATQQRRKGGAGVYYHLSYWGRPHDYLWLTTTQPGLLYNEMREAYDHQARRLWIVNVHDPKVAAYDLSLFMDMAWDIDAVKPNTLQQHLQNWLTAQFGEAVGKRLLGPMTTFYHLTAIRRPEFMGWNQVELDKKKYNRGWSPVSDTEFSTSQFGNELERYLADYEALKREVDEAEKLLRPGLEDAFFAAIKYPVYGAAAMATKQLEAQRARALAADGHFHDNPEALRAAVRSWEAYQEILALTTHYNKQLADGKWEGNMDCKPRDLLVFQAPTLPDSLSNEELQKYAGRKPIATAPDTDGCLVYNACSFVSASPGATPIELLGHSMKAVALPKGGSLHYRFDTKEGDAVLRTALIPTQANDKGDIRYSVSIDGGEPVVYSLKEPYRSERWKTNVLRGQALRETTVHLSAGPHTLEIKALDNHIIVDQWMIDDQPNRQFYRFPVKAAM
ncbi:MAG: glycosyl hydrolase 115 family protein [Prevotella sp.]|nr:glycosyl hydrolase 115 family protein [Prevotella sp.]